jgi:Fic family protein
MTYVLRLHDDPYMELNAQFIRSLHYMMLNYDMTLLPGQWRPGPIYVVREATGETVYEGPEASLVPGLVQELVDQIAVMREQHDATVVGAMSHLNLAMIHPFRDGNGRMARTLQTLVLARDGIVSPEFCGIEEWLGRNTDAYYRVLEETGHGEWHPENDAHPWVRFCLIAHYQQAATIKKRSILVGRIWGAIEQILKPHRLPDRVQTPLMDAAFGYQVKNQRYRSEHSISEVVASRDLKHLCDIGLLQPVGEKRGRYYVAAEPLSQLRAQLADRTRVPNPYDLVADRQQLSLGI